MDLIDRLRDLASRAQRVLASIQTEEACKNAFVMPFLTALGYDVFNPEEVVPEFVADVGTKKGEKVDYAVRKDGRVILLVECKWSGRDLKVENASQLFRYFTVTETRCAILTNGLIYQFFTDIDEPNKMDKHPFFTFNLLDFTDQQVDELKKFSRNAFDLDNVLGSAAALKYTNQVKVRLATELANPSEEMVRFIAGGIYQGRMTQSVREQFTEIVRNSFSEFVREKVNDRLKSALKAEGIDPADVQESALDSVRPNTQEGNQRPTVSAEPEIVTTEEEREAFSIVKAIARQVVDAKRVVMRDAKSYCAILLDDNNRKPIARLHFNSQSKRYLGLFSQKAEERIEIQSVDDIFLHSERIAATVREYCGAD